jgi:ATP-binding cassette, subfamily B, bacterial PglK
MRMLYSIAGSDSTVNFIVDLGLLIIVVLLLKNSFTMLVRYINFKFSFTAQHIFSRDLYNSYLKKNYLQHVQLESSTLLRNVTSITGSLVNGIMIPSLMVLTDLIIMTSLVIMLLYINPEITLYLTLGAGTVLFGIVFFTKKVTNNLGTQKERLSLKMYKVLSESFKGIKDIKVFNKERLFSEEYEEQSEQMIKVDTGFNTLSIFPPYLIEFIGIASIILAVRFLLLSGTSIKEILPLVTFYVMAAYRMLPILSRFPGNIHLLKFYSFALDIIYRDLRDLFTNKNTFKKDSSHTENPITFNKNISIESLKFKYPTREDQALGDVSLEIPYCKTVAFIGRSGSGKTTLVDLLMGLFPADSGKIKLDGVELTDHSLFRDLIGYVPQNIFLLDDTIARNIAFTTGHEQIDREKVSIALKLAQLDELVSTLPKGIDTYVGENGVQISGGQRQRIGIARALYKDPALLVFDEATSSLDNETEAEIMDSIYSLGKSKTILIVAHRLSTIKNCDIIYLMGSGKVLDTGKFDELSKKHPDFFKLENQV